MDVEQAFYKDEFAPLERAQLQDIGEPVRR